MSRISDNLKQVWGKDHEWLIDGHPDDNKYGWKDMTSDLTGRGVGATAPTWATYRDGISAQQFAKGDEVQIVFHPNHDVAVGSLYYPHLHWSTNSTTSTGTVVWTFEITQAEGHDTDAFPATTSFDLSYTFTENKQYQHFVTEVSDAQAASLIMPDVDSLILMKITRKNDAADTFAGNVFGFTADIHYRANRYATVSKAPPFNTP